jgi:hypothetical protein
MDGEMKKDLYQENSCFKRGEQSLLNIKPFLKRILREE